MRPRSLAVRLVALVTCATVVPVTAGGSAGAGLDVRPLPFAGLGAWIDVFDYAPAFVEPGALPDVTPATVDDLAELGVETIYLQAAIDDPREDRLLADRRRVGAILERAHEHDVSVVAWYYPQLVDPARDLERLRALARFESDGEEFDALALDIESTQVPDLKDRNQRIVRLARHLREAVGDDRGVGAIVYPAVQLEVLNLALWPDFPYKKLAEHVDVWLPMVYWTFRDAPHRDPVRYTRESVRRLRDNLDDGDALVHPVGGLAEASTSADYKAFLEGAKDVDAIGYSIYDADTTLTPAWGYLRGDD